MIFSFYFNQAIKSKIHILDSFEKQNFGENWINIEIDDENKESQEELRDILGENSCAWQEEITSRISKYESKSRKRTNAKKASW